MSTADDNLTKPRRLKLKDSEDINDEIRVTNILISSPSNKNNNGILVLKSKRMNYNKKSFVNYQEAMNFFLSLFLTKEKIDTVSSDASKKDNLKQCCLVKFIINLFPSVKLNKELVNDLNFVSFLYSIEFNNKETIHINMISTVYLFFFNINTNEVEINIDIFKSKKGNRIIFALMSMLFISQQFPSFMQNLFSSMKTSIFAMFNRIAEIVYEVYKNEKMIRYYNKNNNVLETLNEFVIGIAFLINDNFQTITIGDFEEKLNKRIEHIRNFVMKESPSAVLWKAKFVKENYKKEANSMTLSIINSSESK